MYHVCQDLIKEYLSPFFGKSTSTTTQKYPLCFLDDPTYNKWMEVFVAWEQGRFIVEDGRKPDENSPKIPQQDITRHDVDRTIDLRDCNMMKLADAILANEVSIKSNKLSGDQQREGVTLQDWCQMRKRIRIVMNELMAEFRGKDLPSKKKEYVAYTDEEWDDLAKEKNLSDETLKNIVVEVEKDKPGLDWLEGRGHALAPT